MATPEHRSVFDLAVDVKLTAGLREISNVPNHQDAVRPTTAPSIREGLSDERTQTSASLTEVSDKMLCSACQCPFQSREEQMEHYKLDWHRFNLKQRLSGHSAVTVEEFEKKTGAGELSSISGSDSEDDDGQDCSDDDRGDQVSLEAPDGGRLSSRVFLQNSEGQFMSLYRCAVQNRRTEGDVSLVETLLKLSAQTVWVILMTGGGHFAGAIFRGKDVVQHKTFHRYTVRAKRGTAQGLRDAQSRGHAPKSAGSALRRYNEAALIKEIHELLRNWAEHLKEASAVFLRTPKYSRSVFFGGRGAPLEKKDTRIRSLPFATRRATFSEVRRVHEIMSTLHIYDANTDISDIINPSKRVWQRKSSSVLTQTKPNAAVTSPVEEEEDDGSADEGSVQLEMVDVTLVTLDLREHEVKAGKKKRGKKKERKAQRNEELDRRDPEEQTEVLDVVPFDSQERSEQNPDKRKVTRKRHETGKDDAGLWEYSLRDALFTACKTGDVALLRSLLLMSERAEDDAPGGVPSPLPLLNTPIDSSGFTLLHVASAAAQRDAVRLLLDAGSDPACRDRKGQTPYAVAPEKDTRNMFRKYMAEHPNKYDYTRAQVPGPLTAEIESKRAEKKKAQKAVRKQREREQKEERERQQQEEEDRRRFLALSDREKRALAAERRLVQQAALTGAPLTNIRRCWQCGESLLGKVPFEYLEFSFCSTRCVQDHRKSSTTASV